MSNSEKKKNILLLSHERKLGGANLCLYELARYLSDQGHNVIVTVLFKRCPLAEKLTELGIRTVPCFYGWWQMPKNWNALLKTAFRFLHWLEFVPLVRLKKLCAEENIDVIYSNTSCIDIGLKLHNQTGIRHIWHFREFGDKDYNFEYMSGRTHSIAQVNAGADKVIFISQALREHYSDVKDNISIVIYDGVPAESCNASIDSIVNMEDGVTKERTVFLSTGNISATKNQMLAVKAFARMNCDNTELWLAGEATSLQSSKEYKADIQKYIKDNHLDNVKILGFVNDMKTLRRQTDIELVPSRSEGFGRVTVEAMLSHNPVIASDTGANPELIMDGETGLLFTSNDESSLAEKMTYLVNNPELIKQMGEKAYEYAMDKFIFEKNVSEIEAILCGE